MESLVVAESEILKTMPAGAIVVEKKSGKIVFVNDRFIELLGFNPKGTSFKEYALNMARARKLDDSPYLFEQLPLTKALLYGKGTTNQEIVLQKTDKTDRIIKVNAKPLNNDKGEIIGAIATFEDNTEVKKAEEALRKSKEQYDVLFNSIDEGFANYRAVYDETGRLNDLLVLAINPAGATFSGIKQEDQIGKTWRQVWVGIPECVFDTYRKVDQTGEPSSFEHFSPITNRWYVVTIYKVEKDQFAVTFFDITERKQAEEALKESEERFSKAFGSSPAVLTITCLEDNKLVDVNETFLKLSEYTREEVIGHTTRELNLFQKPDERDRIFAIALKQGGLRNQELVARTKSGKSLNVLLSLEPIDVGSHKHVISTLIDITELKKNESLLKENEKLYRTLFENTEDGFQLLKPMYDKNGKPHDLLVLKVNKAYERQTGLKQSDVVGKTVKEVIPNLEPYWISTYGNVAKTGKGVHFENYNLSTNRWYDVYAFLYAEDQVGALFRDITERKNLEQTLKKREKSYRELFESMIEFFFSIELIHDTNGRAVDFRFNEANPAGLRFVNLTKEQMIGKTAKELFSVVEDYWINLFDRVNKTGNAETIENYSAAFDRWFTIYAWRIEDNRIGYIEADITERKKLEKQVKDFERLAVIGQVAGMVGHDIRNPLQAITGELFLAKTEIEEMPKSPKEKALKESLDLIEKQTGYIEKIVKDLQDYVRPLKPELVKVDLCKAISDALSTVEIPSDISSEMACDMPDIKLKMDLTFLKRIMVNLVNNAIQAMPNGGKLAVGVSIKEGKVVITVEDTGVGIAKEVQDKLFTPLFTTKSKGQGFGLVAIKRMTEALGGTISFESQVGKGTKFIIELPIAQ